jgi:predicted GNAT family N-acyltransferase
MEFREYDTDSAAYVQELALRDAVLRQPLGLVLGAPDTADDHRQLHFGLFDGQGNLTACVLVVPVSAERAKIRQMAVAPQLQGRGWGRHLMERMECAMRGRGFRAFELHARRGAEDFYQKLGYTRSGVEFIEVTIPHVTMGKGEEPLGDWVKK